MYPLCVTCLFSIFHPDRANCSDANKVVYAIVDGPVSMQRPTLLSGRSAFSNPLQSLVLSNPCFKAVAAAVHYNYHRCMHAAPTCADQNKLVGPKCVCNILRRCTRVCMRTCVSALSPLSPGRKMWSVCWFSTAIPSSWSACPS